MWPWEHAIVGYLVYSLFARVVYRDSPGGLEALAVVVASVLPDIIDKPLAWEFGIFDSGYAIGHSVFFAIPAVILVGAVARAADRPRSGIAFGLGYLLHLPGDAFYGYLTGDDVRFDILLWPVETAAASETEPPQGFVTTFVELFTDHQEAIIAGDYPMYIRLQLGVAAFVLLLWLFDGAPVLRETLLGGKRVVDAVRDRVRGSTADSSRHR